MIAELPAGPERPRLILEDLIDRHGARRVVLALVAAILRPPPKRLRDAPLNAHLRRDLGLPPDPGGRADYTRFL